MLVPISLNSNLRNRAVWPNSANFQLQIPPIYGAVQLNIRNFCIYNTSYVVNPQNRTFIMRTVSNFAITLPIGNYDSSSLAAALQTALNASGSGLTFAVTDNAALFRFTIAATGSFSLQLLNNAPAATLLGFAPQNTASATSHVSSQVYAVTQTAAYYLRIKELPNTTTAPFGAICTIINGVAPGGMLSNIGTYTYTSACLGGRFNLQTVTIELLDTAGQIVDLGGSLVLFELEFVCGS